MPRAYNKPASAATLTEKALWAHFVTSRIQTTYGDGLSVYSYCPDDLLSDCGMYETTGEIARVISEEMMGTEEPEVTLDCVIADLASYLEGIRTVRNAFASVKKSLMVYSDGDTENREARYRLSKTQSGEAASWA